MRFLSFSLLLFCSFILQISVLPFFSIFGILPNLLLVLLFFFISYSSDGGLNYLELMIFSFASGFLSDIYSGMPFGVIALSFILTVAVVNFLAHNFLEKDNFIIACVGTLIGSVVYSVIYFGIFKLYMTFNLVSDLGFNHLIFFKTMPVFYVLNVVVAMAAYMPLRRFIIFTDKLKK